MLREILYRLRALLRRSEAEQELDEELQYHLQREAEKIGGEAMGSREARLAFGSVEAVKEECREARGTALMESIATDLRYAARALKKSPVFALAAILSLAIGIGANTAVFSLLDRVVFRPLPVERPRELVILRLSQGGVSSSFTYPFFQEVRSRQTALAGMFASADFPLKNLIVRGSAGPEAASCRLVIGEYFQLLGVHAAAGRLLDPRDDQAGAGGVAVISDRFWERRFHRSKDVLGTSLTVNQAQVTIIGVAAPEFFGEKPGSVPDVWIPMAQQPKVMPSDLLKAKFVTWLTVMGRLKPGVSREAATASLTSLSGEFKESTIQNKGGGSLKVVLEDGARGLEDLRREFGRPLTLLMIIAGLVMAIACFNLATLLLARGGSRIRELGVRLALGAGRGRLVRQMLTESALLASIGGVLGMALALWASDALIHLAGEGREISMPVVLDGRMFAFTAGITVGATLLFGLLPALMASSGADPARSIGAENRSMTAPRGFIRGAHVLMVAQIAVSLVVVCGALLMTRSLVRLRHQDFGIRPAGLTMVKLPMELTAGAMKRQELVRGEALERIRALPGVERAAVSCCGPFDDIAHSSKASPDSGGSERPTEVLIVHVSEGYMQTMGMNVLQGRAFTAGDRKETPKVAVLTEYAASRLFGGGPAVGHRISFGDRFDRNDAMEVAGVVKDTRFAGPREEYRALVFVPMSQQPAPVTSISIRAVGGQDRGAEIRKILQQAAPGVGLGEITTYSNVIEKKMQNERMLSLLSGLFAAQVVALAAAGLFGLTWFTAAGRRRELGVRAALGARPGELTRLLVNRAAWLLVIGAGLGCAGAFVLAKTISSFLFGITAQDPVSFAAAAGMLAAAGLGAAFVPAWRAGHADPLKTLRVEKGGGLGGTG